MEGKIAKVEGNKVTMTLKSAATAREIAAAAENEALKKEGGFFGWASAFVEDVGDGVAALNRAVGRGTFEGIALVFMIVGMVLAYLSWSRLFPIGKEGAFLIGLVGAAVVVGVKVSAARWAEGHNTGSAARAEFYSRAAIAGLAIDAIAAFAFATAVTQDAETGRIDYDQQIAAAEREARELEFAAEDLPRPADSAEILQLDLDRLLNRTAKNKGGEDTRKSVGSWIGWDTDAYCISQGTNAFYVDRYCEEVIAADRALRQRKTYEAKLAEVNAKRAEAAQLRAERPEQASALTAGKALSKATGNGLWKYAGPVSLMAVILGLMIYSAYAAKRNPDIGRAKKEAPS